MFSFFGSDANNNNTVVEEYRLVNSIIRRVTHNVKLVQFAM